MDYAALASEINSDPKSIGYAQYVTSGSDGAIADLLNAKTGPGAESINITRMSRDDFTLAILPAIAALPSATDAIQKKWDRFLGTSNTSNYIAVSYISGYLDALVTDGLLAQPQVDAIKTRTGSRAEVLFGDGIKVTHEDVAKALRG